MRRRRKDNIFLWCFLGFILLLVISFVVFAFQLNFCKVNEINYITLVSNSSLFYKMCVDTITGVFGADELGYFLGGLFANFMFGFIITFVCLITSLLITWICKMIVGSMNPRF